MQEKKRFRKLLALARRRVLALSSLVGKCQDMIGGYRRSEAARPCRAAPFFFRILKKKKNPESTRPVGNMCEPDQTVGMQTIVILHIWIRNNCMSNLGGGVRKKKLGYSLVPRVAKNTFWRTAPQHINITKSSTTMADCYAQYFVVPEKKKLVPRNL